ncbi:Crinkler (CRN) [Phytophthora megakarya]|uniref:Crinkler (CRN) n=1 Tax=Phytophthora megakarya TaxID=4795 RepID=A0A225VN63_9STRA|nr:Crinkler (CRN) [Phytophthora megakarya]
MITKNTQGIKSGSANDWRSWVGPKSNRLHLLLPPPYYWSFTKKASDSIRKFAIFIPYPEDHRRITTRNDNGFDF